jgi:chromosome segregation ATPase
VSSSAAREPATADDLRQLEARVDARFQAVNARFATVEEGLTVLDDRLDDIDQRLQALAQRSEARCDKIDRSIGTARTRLDHIRATTSSSIDHAHRDLARIVRLGLLGTTLCTAMLCLGTLLLTGG